MTNKLVTDVQKAHDEVVDAKEAEARAKEKILEHKTKETGVNVEK